MYLADFKGLNSSQQSTPSTFRKAEGCLSVDLAGTSDNGKSRKSFFARSFVFITVARFCLQNPDPQGLIGKFLISKNLAGSVPQ